MTASEQDLSRKVDLKRTADSVIVECSKIRLHLEQLMDATHRSGVHFEIAEHITQQVERLASIAYLLAAEQQAQQERFDALSATVSHLAGKVH